jgi:23S rRNA pseudouridine2605 synthase
MYISQFIARSGLCSRRKSTQLVKAEKVIVNGVIMSDPMYKVNSGDKIVVDGKSLSEEKFHYILLNKPEGYLSTCSDEQGRQTVLALIPKRFGRLYPIGRLDRMTTGLILLTNDGDLSQKLAHPKFKMVKKYQVVLDQVVKVEDLARLRKGLKLRDGFMKVDRVSYSVNKKNIVTLEIHSGKTRIIRRLFNHLWYKVKELDRYYYAGLTQKGLRLGAWRELSRSEVEKLRGE